MPHLDAEQSPGTAAGASAPAWSSHHLADDPHAVADKAARVQQMFAAIARRYDLNNRLHSFGRDQAWRRAAVRAARVQPSDCILDVACGTGDLTECFADAAPASVVGLDFTQPMLEIARHKAAERHRPAGTPTPDYVHGDAMNLPFNHGSFDIVSIAFGIRNVQDPGAAIREFRRVLRPGGRLVILEFSEPRHRLLRALNHFYCAHVMPRTAALIARDRSGAYRYLPKSVQTFLSPAALADRLRGAGFGPVDQSPLTFGVCTVTVARAG